MSMWVYTYAFFIVFLHGRAYVICVWCFGVGMTVSGYECGLPEPQREGGLTVAGTGSSCRLPGS